jgi:RNA polymerase sigma factor (sigma-70 family)
VVGRPRESEAGLVERAKRGDVAAYEELVRAHQDIAFRTALLVTGSAADAEEAAQDGFLKAWRALGRFRSGAPFRPWVLTIVANEARNRRRSAGRRTALTLRAAAERPSGDAAPSPEAALLRAERDGALLAALLRMTERDRLVIACRHLLELSEAETAAAMGCRVGTVKSRHSRALERLRAELAHDREAVDA